MKLHIVNGAILVAHRRVGALDPEALPVLTTPLVLPHGTLAAANRLSRRARIAIGAE